MISDSLPLVLKKLSSGIRLIPLKNSLKREFLETRVALLTSHVLFLILKGTATQLVLMALFMSGILPISFKKK